MVPRRPAQWLKEQVRLYVLVWILVPIPILLVWVWSGREFWQGLLALIVGFVLFEGASRQKVRNLLLGARGELRVARELAPLESEGYRVIHDLDTGHGNIDHVIVGPTGVFAIETKAWKGRIHLGPGSVLMCNGSPRANAVRQSLGAAMEVRSRLSRVGMRPWVEGVIVLTHTKLPKGPIRLRYVSVIEVADLVSLIRSGRAGSPPLMLPKRPPRSRRSR